MVLVARFVIVLSRTLTIKQVNGSIRWLVASYWRLVCLWVTADGGGENPQLIVLPQRQTKDDFLGLRCRGDAVIVRVCVLCLYVCVQQSDDGRNDKQRTCWVGAHACREN